MSNGASADELAKQQAAQLQAALLQWQASASHVQPSPPYDDLDAIMSAAHIADKAFAAQASSSAAASSSCSTHRRIHDLDNPEADAWDHLETEFEEDNGPFLEPVEQLAPAEPHELTRDHLQQESLAKPLFAETRGDQTDLTRDHLQQESLAKPLFAEDCSGQTGLTDCSENL